MLEKYKIMFIGDIHWRWENPINRKDDYRQELKSLVIESLLMAEEIKCDGVIFLGDIFDREEPSGSVRNEVLNLFNKKPDGNPWSFDKYVVVGNHDISGQNPDTIYRTALGTLIDSGIVKCETFIEKYSIFCGHYINKIEEQDWSSNDALIYAMHANILENPFFEGNYVLINDFQTHENTKLVISGHYHPGNSPIIREDDVVFANPGSLCRISAIQANIERQIQIAVVDVDKDQISIEYKPLQSAKNSEDIFDLNKVQVNKERRLDAKSLREKIAELRVRNVQEKSDDPCQDFIKFAKEMDASEEEIAIVIDELQSIISSE